MNKIIKNETDYQEALLKLDELMDHDPSAGTPESDELAVITLLIQDFETRRFKFLMPRPLEAIKFRMEQQNLTPRDLVPYLGSPSKVSEVLSGKRALTISMIRALNSHLKIPASVLIQRKDEEDQTEVVDWDRFPIKAIIDFGWIKAPEKFSNLESEDILKPLFSFPGTLKPQSLLLRSSNHIRSARSMDEYALRAWSARVVTLASKNSVIVPYQPDILTFEFLRGLTKLSSSETGPLEVIEKLKNHGINVIVERHLPRTYIDGAAIIVDPSNPIIGLTLRYDRIDNFWFTLIHELAHLALHLNSENNIYFDDMDIDAEEDQREREANEFASEILIPKELWNKSPASRLRSSVAAEHLAKQLGISPAIVAGRMQHEFKAFKLFTNLVGRGKVRRFFPEVRWE